MYSTIANRPIRANTGDIVTSPQPSPPSVTIPYRQTSIDRSFAMSPVATGCGSDSHSDDEHKGHSRMSSPIGIPSSVPVKRGLAHKEYIYFSCPQGELPLPPEVVNTYMAAKYSAPEDIYTRVGPWWLTPVLNKFENLHEQTMECVLSQIQKSTCVCIGMYKDAPTPRQMLEVGIASGVEKCSLYIHPECDKEELMKACIKYPEWKYIISLCLKTTTLDTPRDDRYSLLYFLQMHKSRSAYIQFLKDLLSADMGIAKQEMYIHTDAPSSFGVPGGRVVVKIRDGQAFLKRTPGDELDINNGAVVIGGLSADSQVKITGVGPCVI